MRLLLLTILALLVACGGDDHNHEHHDHDHDHSHDHDHGHGHAHHASHGGVLIEVGEHEANLEVVHDAEAGVITIYVSGAHAEKPVRIKDEKFPALLQIKKEDVGVVFEAQASALSQETVGDTSIFKTEGEFLKTEDVTHITVDKINIYGKTFTDIKGKLK